MIYDLKNTIDIGNPCRFYDGNGDEITHCVWCDTDTGEAEFLAHCGRGFVLRNPGEILRHKAFFELPISVVPERDT